MSEVDEVAKCKQIAQTAMNAGDNAKAIRFLEKAKRISGADASIDALLAQAQSGGGGSHASPSESSVPQESPPSRADEGFRNRNATASSAGPAPGPSTSTTGGERVNKDGSKYTGEQATLVQKILRTKDYYDMLGLAKDSDENDVKKAYKKFALKLHPDKNKAPGAEEAFKKLSQAVQCLSDPKKKQMYDRYGDEERVPQQQRHHQQDFVSPEDFFASFFAGNDPFSQQGGGQESPAAQLAGLAKIAPVIFFGGVLFLVAFGGSSGGSGSGSGDRFSLTADRHHPIARSTAAVGAPYYVAGNFGDLYEAGTKDLAEFERQIDIYYVRNLHSECDYQETVMKKKVMKANRQNDPEELQKAKNTPRPACKEIGNIRKRHNNVYRDAIQSHR